MNKEQNPSIELTFNNKFRNDPQIVSNIRLQTLFNVRTAAKRRAGFGEVQNNCKTLTAGVNSREVVRRKLTMACTAS